MKNIETRKLYIDNLRTFLITLVMLLHIAVTYGPIGFWYYYERTGLLSTYLLGFFVSFNQAFLLGLFLMISAYFIIPSYDRKGADLFIRDRFRRLGIPLLFYIIIIGPFLIYIQKLFIEKEKVNFLYFYYNFIIKNIIIEAGPLWFLQALLIFSLFYILLVELIKKAQKKKGTFEKKGLDFPQNYKIILFIISIAIVTFLVRIRFPIETSIINLQLCFLPQYVSLFILGIFAYRNNWFKKITYKKAIFWLSVLIFTTLLWPILLFFSGTFKEANITLIAGGFRWQAFLYALWEAIIAISSSISIIYFFKKRLNRQNNLFGSLYKSAYTVFIIHPLIIVPLSYSIKGLEIHPLIKFSIVAAVSIPLSFIIGNIIRKMPFLKRIL
ncbi:MAG: acyltransferase family protein [Actinobacteria bacterium]|nr:acyltransferase family protein [Actinomycetota bacterium]